MTSISDYTFDGCSNLISVTIPNSVKTIGIYAFYGCSNLISVTIPNSVKTIGNHAFDRIDMPTVVTLIDEPFDIDAEVFSLNTRKNATLYVPTGTIDKYKATEGWKEFLYIEEGSGESGVSHVRANTATIKTEGGRIIVTGADDGTKVSVYEISGRYVGSATSIGANASINANLPSGSIAIVKIGDKSERVIVE